MLHKTPENETAVSVPLRISSRNDRVVVVKARTSSEIRWSGIGHAGGGVQTVVGALAEVGFGEAPGQLLAPQDAEALLGEAIEHQRPPSRG